MKFKFLLLFLFLISLPTLSYGGNTVKDDDLINEEHAIEIAKDFLQRKQYDYEINWDNPQARLNQNVLKKDGILSNGLLGKKVWVWHVWFLPTQDIDPAANVIPAVADVNAKTGEVFTKYSMEKL